MDNEPGNDPAPAAINSGPGEAYKGSLTERKFAYRHLAVVMLSTILQKDGTMPFDGLQLQLADEGVAEKRSLPYLTKLGRLGLVQFQGDTVTVGAHGIGYMAKYADRIDEAHEVVRERSEFPASQYQVLSLLEADAKTRASAEEHAALLNDLDPRPLPHLVAEKIGLAVEDTTGIMEGLKAGDLIHEESRVNVLTSAGVAELLKLRDMFPDETEESDHTYKLRGTVLNMSAEIKRMREILGYDEAGEDGEESTPVFDDTGALQCDEMSAIIGHLEINMIELEELIDRKNPRLPRSNSLSQRLARRKQPALKRLDLEPPPGVDPDTWYQLPLA